MKKQQSKHSRRKLLKSIAAGSSAVIAAQNIPQAWQKPIVNAIVLPAHAALTDDSSSIGAGATTTAAPACCEGVFCDLQFAPGVPIGGSAQVNSDCSITMSGGSFNGDWSGSGSVAADGSFSFNATFLGHVTPGPGATRPPAIQELVSGTVSADCSSLSGTIGIYDSFTASVAPGITAPNLCIRS